MSKWTVAFVIISMTTAGFVFGTRTVLGDDCGSKCVVTEACREKVSLTDRGLWAEKGKQVACIVADSGAGAPAFMLYDLAGNKFPCCLAFALDDGGVPVMQIRCKDGKVRTVELENLIPKE